MFLQEKLRNIYANNTHGKHQTHLDIMTFDFDQQDEFVNSFPSK